MHNKFYCAINSTSIQKKRLTIFRSMLIPIASILFLTMLPGGCKKDGQQPKDDEPTPLDTCKPAPAGISYNNSTGKYTINTKGGSRVLVDHKGSIIITHECYSKRFSLELWGTVTVNGEEKMGAGHENLNGKHIKDFLSPVRTLLLPGGAKLTVVAEALQKQILSVTLLDSAAGYRINMTNNTISYTATSVADVQRMDDEQPDGEAGGFEIISTGIKFFNLYTEDTKDNKVTKRYELGEIYIKVPSTVDDYFDDLRLGHT